MEDYNNTYYSYRQRKENKIHIDLSNCKYLGEIHNLLKMKFGFPDYYGGNWSALWDCLDGLFEDDGQIEVEIMGYYDMSEEMQKGCEPMLRIFERAAKTMSNVHFTYL